MPEDLEDGKEPRGSQETNDQQDQGNDSDADTAVADEV